LFNYLNKANLVVYFLVDMVVVSVSFHTHDGQRANDGQQHDFSVIHNIPSFPSQQRDPNTYLVSGTIREKSLRIFSAL